MNSNAFRLALALCVLPAGAAAQDIARGKLLYENHCSTCHTNAVHGRGDRIALSDAQLRSIVQRWQSVQKLGWGPTEIDDVTRYLESTFYRVTPAGKP